jgi:hypothetical protein
MAFQRRNHLSTSQLILIRIGTIGTVIYMKHERKY